MVSSSKDALPTLRKPFIPPRRKQSMKDKVAGMNMLQRDSEQDRLLNSSEEDSDGDQIPDSETDPVNDPVGFHERRTNKGKRK